MSDHPYDDFAPCYGAWTRSAPVAAANGPYYVEALLRADGVAVELGVGDGRIAVEAARRGAQVLGVDASKEMLELCRRRAAEAGVADRVQLQQADFRTFEPPEPAAVVVLPFHSIGHLLTPEERLAAARHVHDQLRPGGRFLFDHFVCDLEYARQAHGVRELRAEEVDPTSGERRRLWGTSLYDFEAGTLVLLPVLERLDAEGRELERRQARIELAWMDPAEGRTLLEQSGFEVEACYGDYDRTPFGPESREHIWIGRRPH